MNICGECLLNGKSSEHSWIIYFSVSVNYLWMLLSPPLLIISSILTLNPVMWVRLHSHNTPARHLCLTWAAVMTPHRSCFSHKWMIIFLRNYSCLSFSCILTQSTQSRCAVKPFHSFYIKEDESFFFLWSAHCKNISVIMGWDIIRPARWLQPSRLQDLAAPQQQIHPPSCLWLPI